MGITAGHLNLPEKVVLLSYDERGRNRGSASNMLNACLCGAALIELLWGGQIRVEGDRVEAVAGKNPNRPMLDRMLAAIAGRKEAVAEWTRLSRPLLTGLREQVGDELMQRGVLALQKGRRLLVLPARRLVPFPGLRPVVAGEIMAALAVSESAEPRDLALAVLADCGFLSYSIYPGPELRHYKDAVESPARAVWRMRARRNPSIPSSSPPDPSCWASRRPKFPGRRHTAAHSLPARETHDRLAAVHAGKTPPFAGRLRASKHGTPKSPWE